MQSDLIERRDGAICRVTLNRPKSGNALSARLVVQLAEVVERCLEGGIDTLVIDGAGKHFCTGFDLSGLAEETDDSLLGRFVRIELLLQRIHSAPFRTVAIARGRVAGAGADLFAACRARIIDGDAAFSFPGASGFGLVLGTRRLAAVIGAVAARDWIVNGRVIGAREALGSDFATDMSPPGEAGARWADVGRPVDLATAGALRVALGEHAPERDRQDLALLVESAARPGLKQRISAYVAALETRRTTPQ